MRFQPITNVGQSGNARALK